MEIFIMSAGLASIYILTKLLIYIIGRRKIQTPELFSWKASILEYLSTIFALLLGYLLFIYISPYVEELNYNVHVLRGLQGALFYGFPLWLIPSFYQRRLELEADAFAAQLTSKECMIASLEKLNYITNGMVSKGGDTHPSLKKRLNNILQK